MRPRPGAQVHHQRRELVGFDASELQLIERACRLFARVEQDAAAAQLAGRVHVLIEHDDRALELARVDAVWQMLGIS